MTRLPLLQKQHCFVLFSLHVRSFLVFLVVYVTQPLDYLSKEPGSSSGRYETGFQPFEIICDELLKEMYLLGTPVF